MSHSQPEAGLPPLQAGQLSLIRDTMLPIMGLFGLLEASIGLETGLVGGAVAGLEAERNGLEISATRAPAWTSDAKHAGVPGCFVGVVVEFQEGVEWRDKDDVSLSQGDSTSAGGQALEVRFPRQLPTPPPPD